MVVSQSWRYSDELRDVFDRVDAFDILFGKLRDFLDSVQANLVDHNLRFAELEIACFELQDFGILLLDEIADVRYKFGVVNISVEPLRYVYRIFAETNANLYADVGSRFGQLQEHF